MMDQVMANFEEKGKLQFCLSCCLTHIFETPNLWTCNLKMLKFKITLFTHVKQWQPHLEHRLELGRKAPRSQAIRSHVPQMSLAQADWPTWWVCITRLEGLRLWMGEGNSRALTSYHTVFIPRSRDAIQVRPANSTWNQIPTDLSNKVGRRS